MNNEETFPQWMKRRRMEMGLTQEDLAFELEVSTSCICRIEQDKVTPSDKNKILIENYFN